MFQTFDSVDALLINKKKGRSFYTGKPVYKLVFQTKLGILNFEVDEDCFHCVEVGYKGLLKADGSKLISFGKWIELPIMPVTTSELSWLQF